MPHRAGDRAIAVHGAWVLAETSADAGEHASCVGLEFTFDTPPGTSEEFAGGGRELVEECIPSLTRSTPRRARW
jgi:hypothetical protein